MMFYKSPVALAVSAALHQQAEQARALAEQERRRAFQTAITSGMGETDKHFGGGLMARFRAGLNRLRGKRDGQHD